MARPPKAREPLKEAALQLFVESGIHATGIREIAKHAGCSEAALYRHWSNKEDLVTSLFHEHLAEVVGLLEDAIAAALSIADKITAAAEATFRLYDEQPLVFRFVMLVQHEMARHLDGSVRMPQDVVTDLVHLSIERGETKGNADLMAAFLIGIFLQTANAVLYGRLPGPMLQYAASVSDACLCVLDRYRP